MSPSISSSLHFYAENSRRHSNHGPSRFQTHCTQIAANVPSHGERQIEEAVRIVSLVSAGVPRVKEQDIVLQLLLALQALASPSSPVLNDSIRPLQSDEVAILQQLTTFHNDGYSLKSSLSS